MKLMKYCQKLIVYIVYYKNDENYVKFNIETNS